MIRKLNRKGLTTIEILICFVLIAVISVSMYSTVSSYNNKQYMEASKEKIATYKNLLTKEIQDDLIKRQLVGADYKMEEPSPHIYKHVIHLTFADGSGSDLIINQQVARDYDFAADDDQNWPCHDDKYSFEYGDVVFPIPDLGYGENKQTNCPGGTSDKTVKVLDLRIQNVIVTTTDGVLHVKVDFYHVDLPDHYGINIIAPMDYTQGGSIATDVLNFSTAIEKLPEEEGKTCIEKYEGPVTDQVNNTVTATKVYFNKCEDTRHVIFGGFCWQVIRTTETGGTKLLYNGEPVDGKCESTRPTHMGVKPGSYSTSFNMNTEYLYGSSFTTNAANQFVLKDTFTATWSDATAADLISKYTCKTTGDTCDTLYYIEAYNSNTNANTMAYTMQPLHFSQIAGSVYNTRSSAGSVSSVGYMYNTEYRTVTAWTLPTDVYYGNDVTYSDGVYTLFDPKLGLDANHHYSCNLADPAGNCASVRYYYDGRRYIVLSGGKKVGDAINDMLYADDVNKYDSMVKKFIDDWYFNNLMPYTNKLEDVVYCNDRTLTNIGSFNPNGGTTSAKIEFINYNNSKLTLDCQNITDQFSVSNSKAKLKYPVALLGWEEILNIRPAHTLIFTQFYGWWTMSPTFYYQMLQGMAVDLMGPSLGFTFETVDSNSLGIRPVVSLAPNVKMVSGTGLETDPWIVN